MQLGHPVDLVADHYRQPGHPHTAAVRLVDNRGAAEEVGIVRILLLQGLEEIVVNLEDNLQMARQNFTQHIHRPGLERFAHQGVVGIGEDLTGHLERLVPAELMFVDKQTHQLRYRQHRVGVIQVNGNLVRQVVIGLMQHVMATQDILHRGRHEEILLAQAQLAAGVGRVVRIEHAGDVFGVVFILYRGEVVALVEFTEVNFAAGLRAPQTQRVGGVGVKAGDDLVVGFRNDLLRLNPAGFLSFLLNAAAEAHFIAGVVALKLPRVTVLQPVVRRLFLSAIDNILFKHPVVVADAVTASRQTQRRQGVKEASRQAAQTAVAKPGVILFIDQLFEIEPHLRQRAAHIVINAQRQQRIREGAADQKLHRQIVHLAHFLGELRAVGAQPALHHAIANGKQRGVKPFMLVGDGRIFTDDKHQFIGNRML